MQFTEGFGMGRICRAHGNKYHGGYNDVLATCPPPQEGVMRTCTGSAEQVLGVVTSTEDTVEILKKHFDKPVDKPFPKESVPGIFGVLESISEAEVTKVAILYIEKAAGVDERLKALYMLGVVWLTHLFNTVWRSGVLPFYWQFEMVIPIF